MKKTALILLSVALLACGISATAAPNFFGATGLFQIPTAYSLSMGNLNAFGNFTNANDLDTSTFGANVGIGLGLEAGIAVVNNSSNDLLINAKWNFMRESFVLPGVAVGVLDASGSDFIGSSLYGVASKTLSVPGKPWKVSGHVGYVGGGIKSVFAGVDATIDKRFTLIAESFDGNLNVGVRFAPIPEVRVDVAALDGNLGFAASYNFGLR